MQFTKQMLEAILRAKNPKTQTRRIVKKYEELAFQSVAVINYNTDEGITKWQVGRNYPIQTSKGSLWQCPQCTMFLSVSRNRIKKAEKINDRELKWGHSEICKTIKQVRFTITAIKQQTLLDITEAEAKREGFKSRYEFLKYFYKIYKIDLPYNDFNRFLIAEKNSDIKIQKYWNPEVWVISFCLKGDK